jgi:hypothetical protein
MREFVRVAALSVVTLLVATPSLPASAQPPVAPPPVPQPLPATVPVPGPVPPPVPVPAVAPAPAPGTAPAPAKTTPPQAGEEGADLFGPLPTRTMPAMATVVDTSPRWRRLAFGVTAGAAGVSLIGGLSFLVAESQKVREFNAYVAPPGTEPDRCTAGIPNDGAPGCTQLLNEARRARTWSIVSFSFAGAFAATALVLRLTYPDRAGSAAIPGASAPRLACAPVPGALAATCQATF